MFYLFVRAVVGFALRLFYRVTVVSEGAESQGPVIFVANHPNAIIDPALVFVVTRRKVTFLAKAPLFKMPVLGWIVRGMGCLPVYRKQDNPGSMRQNEGTFESASKALVSGGAITLFPEGRSHSEPQLGELKTGAARIAFRAHREGAKVSIVPVGLTYADKAIFRSEVRIETGAPIEVAPFLPADDASEPERVRALTAAIDENLRKVTLNLERWEDLPLLETAEQLYALRHGEEPGDAERKRRFARGAQLLRAESPERWAQLQSALTSFRSRLSLVRADPGHLTVVYQRGLVWWFAIRNLARLVFGLPLFVIGLVVFALPYQIPRLVAEGSKVDLDTQATVKFLVALVLSPVVLLAIGIAGWRWHGPWTGISLAVAAAIVALFTRYALEHLADAWKDARVFFTLGSRARLKALLLVEGERLSAELERLASELGARVETATPRAGAKSEAVPG